jgi:hypothetical protein
MLRIGWRRIAAGLALAVAGAGLALALAEGLTRWLAPHVRDHVVPGGLFEADPLLGWKLRPGARAVHHTRAFQVEYAINADGFRDRPRPHPKAPGTRRVLLYGDSQVFGWGVSAAARFSDLTEARLGGVELCNLAVPGYGLDQQLLAYERDGDRWAADEVVLFVSPLTLRRTHHETMYQKPKPRFVLDRRGQLTLRPLPPSRTLDWFYPLLSHLYVPYLVERWQLAADPPPRATGAPAPPVADRLAAAVLARASARAAQRGHRLTVLLSGRPARAVRGETGVPGTVFLEIALPAGVDLRLSAHDPHWNARAHALVAAQLVAHWGPDQRG